MITAIAQFQAIDETSIGTGGRRSVGNWRGEEERGRKEKRRRRG